MDLLGAVQEKYADELTGLIPLSGIIVALLLIPPILAISDGAEQDVGFVLSFMKFTPQGSLSVNDGLVWTRPWAWWVLFAIILFGATLASRLLRMVVVNRTLSSPNKLPYLSSIDLSARQIKQALNDTKKIEEALLKKYSLRKRVCIVQSRVAEVLTGLSFISICFVVQWAYEDFLLFLISLLGGALVEISSYRYYIRAVAPSYLLHGYLTDSFVQIDDGYLQ